MKHEPVLRVIGLNDDESPVMTIRTECSCGAFISERTVDVSRKRPTGPEAQAMGEADADAFLRHVEEYHADV